VSPTQGNRLRNVELIPHFPKRKARAASAVATSAAARAGLIVVRGAEEFGWAFGGPEPDAPNESPHVNADFAWVAIQILGETKRFKVEINKKLEEDTSTPPIEAIRRRKPEGRGSWGSWMSDDKSAKNNRRRPMEETAPANSIARGDSKDTAPSSAGKGDGQPPLAADPRLYADINGYNPRWVHRRLRERAARGRER
jgi:hypothetical protein